MKAETYRAACEQARAELRDILSEFESLRTRKEQIERMIEVLAPLSGPDDGLAATFDRAMDKKFDYTPVAALHEMSKTRAEEPSHEEAPVEMHFTALETKAENEWEQPVAVTMQEPMAAIGEVESDEVFEPEEVSSDPIKRRIANALRHRVVLRDNREFNQAISGGITRW